MKQKKSRRGSIMRKSEEEEGQTKQNNVEGEDNAEGDIYKGRAKVLKEGVRCIEAKNPPC